MSYDVSLVIDAGAEYPTQITDCGNYTYNVSPMYYDVLEGGLKSLDGMVASVAAICLEGAIAKLEASPDKYKAMNPANKWGDYEGAIKFLRRIRNNCLKYPKTIVSIS